ncbi:MAG: hypothetical protein OQK12_14510 [Motiliproteus sp.]|nr:hypothetical protein [Motiliproteus sp.]MCW9053746.1 hypothetical protein [Motiliproteus sp.]
MIKQLITGLVVTGLTCNLAFADNGYKNNRHGKARIHYAKVVNVDPITETLTHRVPRETCWTEQVAYQEPGYRNNSYTPALIGGLIGAAVGNSLGKKHHKTNRTIKAVALGALGASIGRDMGRRHHTASRVEYRDEQRCEVSYETSYEERIVGYDVRYRYRGETYNTKMDYDPGNKIRVRVNVRPVI